MGSSTNKGNISTALLVISLLILALLIICVGSLMVASGSRSGHYENPIVAQDVIRGTIYDRNQRALAVQVPQNNLYIRTTSQNLSEIEQVLSLCLDTTPSAIESKISNSSSSLVLLSKDLSDTQVSQIKESMSKEGFLDDIFIQKTYVRTYPALFHACQIIDEVESTYDSILLPLPGYNENTTFGENIHLTIDLDVQYLLDLALSQLEELQAPDYITAFILDAKTQEILACSTTPFYDLNYKSQATKEQRQNKAFVQQMTESFILIKSITDYENTTVLSRNEGIESFYKNNENFNDENSIYRTLESSKGSYIVFIASSGARHYEGFTVLEYALSSIQEGLISQNKL